jgi:hypothetical protein
MRKPAELKNEAQLNLESRHSDSKDQLVVRAFVATRFAMQSLQFCRYVFCPRYDEYRASPHLSSDM